MHLVLLCLVSMMTVCTFACVCVFVCACIMQAEAEGLVVPNAFGALLTRAGGVGLNASTAHDETRYFLSLPANKLELWFAMEAERFRWV